MALLITDKGQDAVALAGFIYVKHTISKNGQKQYWRCNQFNKKDVKCPGRAISPSQLVDPANYLNLVPTAAHKNHHNVHDEIEAKTRLKVLKVTAKSQPTLAPRHLITNVYAHVPVAVRQHLPNEGALQRTISRKREIEGRKDVDEDDIKNVIIGAPFNQTLEAVPQQFLIFDSRTLDPNKPVILLFLSPDGIRRLRTYRDWCGDGQFTFKPKNVSQLYTICSIYNHQIIPCGFAFMENKDMDSYTSLFGQLNQLVGATPVSFMADFEYSVQQTVRTIWPTTVLKGCLFHLSQSVYRQVQKKGYSVLYESADDTFKKAVRCLTALSLIPVPEVGDAFQKLLDNIPNLPAPFQNPTKDIYQYFDTYYVAATANFPKTIWNHYGSLIADKARTNNGVEGWHNSFRSYFTEGGKIAFSKVILAIKREELKTRDRLRLHEADNNIPYKDVNKNCIYKKNSKQLLNLVTLFHQKPQNQQDVLLHLEALQYHF